MITNPNSSNYANARKKKEKTEGAGLIESEKDPTRQAFQKSVGEREQLAARAGITPREAAQIIREGQEAELQKGLDVKGQAKLEGNVQAQIAEIENQNKQKQIINGQEPQGFIGQALSQSPLGMVQQATGAPIFDLTSSDIDRVSRLATAGGIAAGISLIPSIAATTAGLFNKLGKLGSLAIGFGTGALTTAAKGSDLDQAISSTETNINSLVDAVKLNPNDADAAILELQEINELLATEEQTYKAWSSTTGSFFPQKGISISQKYAKAKRAYETALLTILRIKEGASLNPLTT